MAPEDHRPAPGLLAGGCLPGAHMPIAPLDARAARAHVHAADGAAPSLVDQVARVPTDPGCYLWKDA